MPQNFVSKQVGILALVVSAAVFLFWSHTLLVPFWQDDFDFLYLAQQAREAGKPWYSSFFPEGKGIFWRPLSEGVYWRVVEGLLDANPVAAHLLNLLCLVAAALAVGWLAATLARLIMPQANPTLGALVAALLYGIHGVHFIPTSWATAVHSSMVVLFSSLVLRFWVANLKPARSVVGWSVLLVPIFFLLALFSKENAILVPLLAALLTFWVWPRYQPTDLGWIVVAVCAGIALTWLLLRQQYTFPPSGPYAMQVGYNIPRNALSMFLFFFNVPREALRFIITHHSLAALLWGLSCLILQAIAFGLMLWASKARITRRGALVLFLFFVIASAPYFLFAWNSYAYYIALGLIVWPMIAALSASYSRVTLIALAAALGSSSLASAGVYVLDYPALIARARWAEQQLNSVQSHFQPALEQGLTNRLYVMVEDEHRYLGFGTAGLAYTLGLKKEQIVVLQSGGERPNDGFVLVVPRNRNIYWEERRD